MKKLTFVASTVAALLAVSAQAQTKKPRSAAEQAKLDRYNETYNAELDARLKKNIPFEQAEAEAYQIGKAEHDGRGSEVESLKIVKKPALPKTEVKKALPTSTTASSKAVAPAAKPEIAKPPAPAKPVVEKQETKVAAPSETAAASAPAAANTATSGWVDPPPKNAAVPQDKQSTRSSGWVDVPEKKPGDSDQMKAAILMKERAELKIQEITGCKMTGTEQTCTCVRGLTNGARLDKLIGARTLVSEAKSMVPTLDVSKTETQVTELMSASAQKEDYCDRVARLKNEAAEKKAAESGVDRSKVKVIYGGPAYNTSYTPEGKKGVAGSVRID